MKKILLIDDDPDELPIVAYVVSKLDFQCECIWAQSAADAVKILVGSRPDVILLDVNMPRINGWECLSFLKKEQVADGISIIMYSNGIDATLKLKAKNFGAVDAVTKTPDDEELLFTLRKILE